VSETNGRDKKRNVNKKMPPVVATLEEEMKAAKIILISFFWLSALCWIGAVHTFSKNADLLKSYHEEYAGGGSMKFRTSQGKSFQNQITIYGLSGYLLMSLGGLCSFIMFFLFKARNDRLFAVASAIALLILFIRFINLEILKYVFT